MKKDTTENKKSSLKTKFGIPLMAVALIASAGVGAIGVGIAGVASAQSAPTTVTTTTATGTHSGTHKSSGVMGTVASVSGNTITVTGKNGTTYTVDASNAKFLKGSSSTNTTATAPSTVTIANIAVGDTVAIRGTVTGTSVVATTVMDGLTGHSFGGRQGGPGRGQGVTGTVSAVNGNTITVTKSDGTTYTIDATNAKVSEVVTYLNL